MGDNDKNGGKNGKNRGDKGGIRHLTTFEGRQNYSPPWAPITLATLLYELAAFVVVHSDSQGWCTGLKVTPACS